MEQPKKRKRIEEGCTTCPCAGHFELRECPDAYTEKSQYCNLYSHKLMPIWGKEEDYE